MPSATSHLLQCLFPAVRLVTERTLELLGHSAVVEVPVAPLDVPLAHLLLEVLLEAGLVGELPEAVGALERHALGAAPSAPAGPSASHTARTSGVRSLHVVVQEALLGEVLREICRSIVGFAFTLYKPSIVISS